MSVQKLKQFQFKDGQSYRLSAFLDLSSASVNHRYQCGTTHFETHTWHWGVNRAAEPKGALRHWVESVRRRLVTRSSQWILNECFSSSISGYVVVVVEDGQYRTPQLTWQPRGSIVLQITVGAPRLGQLKALPAGGITMKIEGELGRSYVIEGSTDLVTWQALAAVENSAGTLQFVDRQARMSSQDSIALCLSRS